MNDRYETKLEGFVIRKAEESDTKLVLDFIKALADYEKLPNEVSATEDVLHDSLFVKRAAEVIIGEYHGEPVAFSLFFHNFSTFQGKRGLYLEDLFVKPEMRGHGFGGAMLAFLAKTAKERDCGRFEWICLDWNESALAVYRKLGAIPMTGWTIQRLEGTALDDLAMRI
ncbi:MAG: GNAT family N-acetyltransferase [Clostridium sp. SCN 57-10]|nr:MAG: GNAT family N-acetyltransferase [Clostridium sp. SCN 57-10]